MRAFLAGLLAAGILVLVPSPGESVKGHCTHISTTSTFQFRVVDGRYQRRTVVRIVHHCADYTQETLRRYPWAWSTGPIR